MLETKQNKTKQEEQLYHNFHPLLDLSWTWDMSVMLMLPLAAPPANILLCNKFRTSEQQITIDSC